MNAGALRGTGLKLDVDLVELAGLAHDLGHPPFGHTGEQQLDELMREHGGFEGNAQTLRILTRLEKKLVAPLSQVAKGQILWYDERGDRGVGLNLCARSLAAILKYDAEIPWSRPRKASVAKGYYASEAPLVEAVRRHVGKPAGSSSRTVECQIMDLADDVAYSTYDIEDAFRAQLLSPLDLIAAPDTVLAEVAGRCGREIGRNLSKRQVATILRQDIFPQLGRREGRGSGQEAVAAAYRQSTTIAGNSFYRGALTSSLVDKAVRAVTIEINRSMPVLSAITMDPSVRAQVSVLKHFVYVWLIDSPRMRLVAYRGRRVVRTIFRALTEADGWRLLPIDWQDRYEQAPPGHRRRVVCDFVAGMTDRQSLDFFARLTSSSFRTMFGLH